MGAAIGHFGPPVLFIEDLERSKTFYVDALGFTLAFGDSTSAGLFLGDEMFLFVTVPSAEDMLPGRDTGHPEGPASRPDCSTSSSRTSTRPSSNCRSKGMTSSSIRWTASGDAGRRTSRIPTAYVWEISQSIE